MALELPQPAASRGRSSPQAPRRPDLSLKGPIPLYQPEIPIFSRATPERGHPVRKKLAIEELFANKRMPRNANAAERSCLNVGSIEVRSMDRSQNEGFDLSADFALCCEL